MFSAIFDGLGALAGTRYLVDRRWMNYEHGVSVAVVILLTLE